MTEFFCFLFLKFIVLVMFKSNRSQHELISDMSMCKCHDFHAFCSAFLLWKWLNIYNTYQVVVSVFHVCLKFINIIRYIGNWVVQVPCYFYDLLLLTGKNKMRYIFTQKHRHTICVYVYSQNYHTWVCLTVLKVYPSNPGIGKTSFIQKCLIVLG